MVKDSHIEVHAGHSMVDRTILLLLIKRNVLTKDDVISLLSDTADQLEREEKATAAKVYRDLLDAIVLELTTTTHGTLQ